MKLTILADSFLHDQSTGINGTQVQNYNLAAAFARRGVDVHYLAVTRDREKPSVEQVDGITLHWLAPCTGLFGYLRENKAYLALLDDIAPEAIYNRGRSALTFAAARWARQNGARFVWGSNGEDSCDFWKRLDRLKRSQRPLWKKLAYLPHELVLDLMIHRGIRGADAAVNQTEHQKSRLFKNYGKNGIVLPSYFLPPEEGGAEKDRRVLWLANLSHAKQPEAFLRLAGACRDQGEWTFVLAGGTRDTAYEESLRRQAEGIGNVRMAGAVPFAESGGYFKSARIFVNTSAGFADGVPNAMLQAWLHETPVASLNHDPNGWITDHGLGFCADGDEEALADWVRTTIQDEQSLRQMGTRCRAFAESTFASQETIDAYLHFFSGDSAGAAS